MRKMIFVDLKNKEQAKWWFNNASKRVKVINHEPIIETATNKTVALLIHIKGLKARKIYKENLKFIDNPVKVKIF